MRLVSWVGGNDIDPAAAACSKSGAIAPTIAAVAFSELYLLCSYSEDKTAAYLAWLGTKTSAPISARFEVVQSPIDYHDIYIAADRLPTELTAASNEPTAVLISPGTPAMQSVWILLGQTKHQVTFYQSTLEQGVQQVDIPFDISAEFVPKSDRATAQPAEQNDIVTQSSQMKPLKCQATALAKKYFREAFEIVRRSNDQFAV